MAQDFYEMYLEEMGQIAPMSAEEEARILERTAAGEVQARKRLVEGNLQKVLSIAKEYEGSRLPMADIVQEANTALMLAAVEYDASEEWEGLLERRVKEGVELALKEQKAEHEIEENMAARVNVLQTVSQMLAAELGREASVEELAAKMKMTEDEIKDIMKLALNAITVNGEGQADPADGGGDQALGHNPVRDGWSLEEL